MMLKVPLKSSSRKWFVRQKCIYRAVITAAFCARSALIGSAAPMPGLEWWFSASTDSNWTNRSVQEIRKEAEAGEPVAQYYVGRAWFFGVSGKRDMQESYDWVQRSAELGYAQAQLALARFYFIGLVVARDNDQGFRWATRAAEQGNADAMGQIGLNYEFGQGTPRDASKALEWLQRAEKAGSRAAPRWMGDFYLRGEGRTAKRTNYVEALRCYERAASNGIASAAVVLADMCWKGMGTPPNSARALHWLRHFADRNNPDVLERLATAYVDGAAEPRDTTDTPTELIRRAAEGRAAQFEAAGEQTWAFNASWDLVHDCQELWNRYRFGIGTPRDYVATARWMWQAYREDLHRDANGKGSFTGDEKPPHPFQPYLKGEVIPLTTDERLWQQGVRLIHEALDENRPEAWHQIGEYYRDGSPLTPKRPVVAWVWFNRAAELGHGPSKNAIESLQKILTPSEMSAAQAIWLPRSLKKSP